ncbi:MAG: radical SAM protein [Candidatus Bathyarchaeia archaeon]
MTLISPFDPWASKICSCPRKYSLSPYTGCSHSCLYCYITSYIRDPFNARPKKNLTRRLARELSKIDRSIPITMASSSDPYTPPEERLQLTRSTIKLLLDHSSRFLIVTKSDLITRDIDLLRGASAAVSITVTTLDRDLAAKLEPSAPAPSRRLRAIRQLSNAGIPCSARIDPIIPGLNSDREQLQLLTRELSEAGVRQITASTYKARPDSYRRLIQAFPSNEGLLRRLYWESGEVWAGSRYLDSGLRLQLIMTVKEAAEAYRVRFASCREGFASYSTSASCDSSHLIPAPARLQADPIMPQVHPGPSQARLQASQR